MVDGAAHHASCRKACEWVRRAEKSAAARAERAAQRQVPHGASILARCLLRFFSTASRALITARPHRIAQEHLPGRNLTNAEDAALSNGETLPRGPRGASSRPIAGTHAAAPLDARPAAVPAGRRPAAPPLRRLSAARRSPAQSGRPDEPELEAPLLPAAADEEDGALPASESRLTIDPAAAEEAQRAAEERAARRRELRGLGYNALSTLFGTGMSLFAKVSGERDSC